MVTQIAGGSLGTRVKCVPVLCVLPRETIKNSLWTEDQIEIRSIHVRTDKLRDARNCRRGEHHSLWSRCVNSGVDIYQVRVSAGLIGQHQHLRD